MSERISAAEVDLDAAWDQAGALIAAAVGPENYDRWFEEVRLVAANEEQAVLEVPNSIYPLWIEMNYEQIVVDSIAVATGKRLRLSFEIADDLPQVTAAAPTASAVNGHSTAFVGSAAPAALAIDEDGEDAGTPPNAVGIGSRAQLTDRVLQRAGIRPQYSFSNFVVGDSNRFCYAMAKAVSDAPGRTYNPLFLHSKSGLGKTHLMHSIGYAVLQRNPRARVLYRTSEEWVNEFIEALEHRSLSAFRSRYRNIDVLLLDDVQFLGGKEQSKSEFFHTFNTLFDGHKQIVLCSDCPASEIRQIEPRLRSRFDCGMTAELAMPNRETRLAILQSKAQKFPGRVDAEVLEFLADRVTSDIRTLEGALIRAASYSSIANSRPSIAELEMQLRGILDHRHGRVSIDTIQRAVVEYFDLRLGDMTSKDRRAAVAYPRQIAMLLSRQMTDSTLKEIGDAFGGRDHGTVIHAVRKLGDAQGRDREDLDRAVGELKRRIEHA